MSKITCLVIVFLSKGLKESISEENNVTVSLKATLKLQNDTSPSNVVINIKEVLSERRNLAYPDNKYSTASKRLVFSSFLKQAVGILNSYDDQDLEDISAVMDEEVRKYRYNGRGIKTWARSSDTLKRILKQLEIMKEMSGHNLRRHLNQIHEALQQNRLSGSETQFIDFMDSLYQNNTPFLSVINDLNQFKYKFKRSNIYLSDMVKKSLQSLIFNPYKNMELKNKNALNLKMDIFMRKLPVHHREYNHYVKNIKTDDQGPERDESSTNLELQFVPELKVREINSTTMDRLQKYQYHGKSMLETTSITQMAQTTTSFTNMSPENKEDEQQPQNKLKHRLSNINIVSSDITKNDDLLNFILSLIDSAGNSRMLTSTTKSTSQADMLMTLIKSLIIQLVPSKKTESDSDDNSSNPKSPRENIFISHKS